MDIDIFMDKIKDRTELGEILENHRKAGKKIVFTNGCFDIIHSGHCIYLETAREYGEILVVAVNSDESVKKIKGEQKRPIVPLAERMEVLSALEFVDYVTSFDELDPLNIIMELKPNVLIKGGDWPIEKVIGREFVVKNGGDVKTIAIIPGKSTTGIIDKILKRG